jgi:hypothetical protein
LPNHDQGVLLEDRCSLWKEADIATQGLERREEVIEPCLP